MHSIRLYLYITLSLLLIQSLTKAQIPANYNITWSSPSHNSGESMPCGGGDIGLNVWVENGDILIYFSRSGSFDENNALLKGGRLRVRLNPNPFLNGGFSQQLDLQQGNVLIKAGLKFHANIWVDVYHPAVHVDLKSNTPISTTATYESWRTTDLASAGRANNANSWKWAGKQAPGGKVITRKDSIRFVNDQVVFFHHNQPGPTVFDITVHQQGLDSVKAGIPNPLKDLTFGGSLQGSDMIPDGTTTGRYINTDFTGWRLRSQKPQRTQNILLVLATTNHNWQDTLDETIRKVNGNKRTSEAATKAWWQSFWQRSFIVINPGGATATTTRGTATTNPGGITATTNPLGNSTPDTASPQWQIARNYQLFRYMLGCNALGRWPTKFNGGLFTWDPSLTDSALRYTPDFRNWGGGTMTAQNQRLVYFPLTRSGDFDVQRPQLDFYLHLLRIAELRTKIYWGHAGACFTEQLENFGLPNSAEYGWDMPADHDKGVEYNAWLEYEWDTVLEFCGMMLDQQLYAGTDIHEYLPFIESCITFFDEHYQYLATRRGRRPLDGDGHLILYPGSGAETYKMAYNPSSTIAGLYTILTRLLALPDIYGNDSTRKAWTAILRRIPPIPIRYFDGHPAIAPAEAWSRINNKECPQLYPVFPWGIYGVGKPGLDTAINTWKYDTDAIRFRSHIGWKQDNIFAARLGLTEEAANLTLKKLGNSGLRFPAFWGPGFDWTPDLNWGGSGAIGLQEMLLQTDGEKILLFPAWPTGWDVHFKLHAPWSTTVEATLSHGKLTDLKVTPESRRKDVILPDAPGAPHASPNN